ncbi:MAG: TraB/GumN family protein [Massilia sp.]
MIFRVVSTLCVCWMCLPAAAQSTASPDAATELAAPDKVLVVGQRPGPGLWKVTRGDHVLWIFGTYAPMPKNMEWRSQQVETILTSAQEYLAPPSAQTKIGFFKQLTALPQVFGLRNNPNGVLRDVLAPDVYARWLPLKAKYLGKNEDIEGERPLFVADELYRRALSAAGLGNDNQVRDAIEKMVKKRGIKVTEPALDLVMPDPSGAMKQFKKAAIDDGACFATTLDRLEHDIDAMRVRANAWAKGNIALIRTLSFADREGACNAAMLNSSFVKGQPGLQDIHARMLTLWVMAAEQALANNTSSFAMLAMHDIVDPHGFVAALQAKGYAVETPE